VFLLSSTLLLNISLAFFFFGSFSLIHCASLIHCFYQSFYFFCVCGRLLLGVNFGLRHRAKSLSWRLLLEVRDYCLQLEIVGVANNCHFLMNLLKMLWLHLKVVGCVLKTFYAFLCIQCVLEYCCIFTFASFDYLLQFLNEFKSFCSSL
jgi:hypothetical protein